MAHPREITKGASYHVTRRCLNRLFLLLPDPFVHNAFLFCLGLALRKFGVVLHSFICLSNHYHLVVTDPEGRLPQFQQWLNSQLASVMNPYRGRRGPFFHPGSYSSVKLREETENEVFLDILSEREIELGDGEELERAMDYGFLNAVAAGLVSKRSEWPGCWSTYRDIAEGTVFRATRPDQHFQGDGLGQIEDTIEFTLTPPPHWQDLTPEELTQVCTEAELRLDRREEEIGRRLQAEGRTFLGVEAILAQSPFDYPTSPEPRGEVAPHVAGVRKGVRLARIAALVAFRKLYRECMNLLREDPRSPVRFPCGTYWQRVFFRRDVEHPERCSDPLPIPALATGPP